MAIALGKYTSVDGFIPRRKYRVVTHAHSDHTVDLNKSIGTQGAIIATPETIDMLKVLYGKRIPLSKLRALRIGERFRVGEDETLTFVRAEHIPGSVQVLLENDKGFRALYTGDFKNPGSGTPIVEDLDVLIIDATYGHPKYVRPSQNEVLESLIELIEYALSLGRPVKIYAYHGKIQEVMQLLREYNVKEPFVAPNKIYKLSKALERHGYSFGDLVLKESDTYSELVKGGQFIEFDHYNKWHKCSNENWIHIRLDGWLVNSVRLKVSDNRWIVAFSDHADFNGTMYYVEESRPKLVIVDASRSNFATSFASKLRLRGFHAIPMPL
ncbi:hypothetical protein EYM_06365 [Ignicoccus islandicus DSM 13165]|uniref:Metallo-beta-lactamase domain-containing protein n=2 Tax=Ignicoccus islandicus TaxID=54259 RepID=A0A0U3E1Y3_9CREN|nr:hypothetical protein EYM_06365 [Ignicoccus islandicus DSM 13165]